MKTQLLRFIACGMLLCWVSAVSAQETSDNATYYYNNFETATAGNTASLGASSMGNAFRTSSSVTIDASTTSPLNGSVSLQSLVPATNAISAIRWDFAGNGTSGVDMTQNDFEWNFIYKNNSTNGPDDPDVMTVGNNTWRYWLMANSYTTNNMQGIYITHTGTALSLRYRYDSGNIAGHYNELLNATMANDQNTYMIKVQRLKNGRWAIYKDVFVPGMTTAKTLVASSTSTTGSGYNTYYYSYLESTCTTAARFQWDNFDMYTRVLQFSATGVNGAANNVTQPSYYPNESVIFYGMKIIARGNFNFTQLAMNTSGSGFEAYFNGSGSLYRSDDSYYSTSSDLLIASMSLTGNAIQNYNINDSFATSGGTDGSYAVPGYYFFSGSTKTTLNYGNTPNGTITVTSINTLTGNGNNTSIAYTGPSSNGNVITFTNTPPPSPPSVAPVTLCGAGSATLTATGTSGSGTYNWYIDNTTTTPLYTSTTNTYTPFIGGTTTLYVSFTSGGATSSRTAVTITVNPKASSSINSPMLSYPFENGSLTDWSGLGNNGTLQGSTLPTTVADRNGLANGAYSFSGSNASPQYISTTTQYSPLIFSYSVWFKTTTAGGKLIGIGGNQTGSNATQDRNLYMNDSGQLYYGVYSSSAVTINTPAGTAYNDGLWHHVIVTDGPTNGMRLYVDGTLQASTATYTTPQQISEYWRIGGDSLQGWPGRPSNDYFVGVLDDIAIYNHELSASEIASNDMNLYKFSSSYCANNPITINAQSWPGSPAYSWVDNANSSLTGTGSQVTFSKATTTNYTLTTTTNGCTQSTAIVTPAIPTYTWTGAAGTTDLTNANNWTNTSTGITGVAPALNGTEYIVIPTNSSNIYPVLTAAKSVYTLNIASGAKLNLGGFTLSVGCNIFNSGTLTKGTTNYNNSAITWNGVSPVAAQSFTGNSTAASTDVGNMTVNNTATNGVVTLASGKLDLYNVLTLTSGSLAVSSPATFTLKSNSTQTATVAAIPSGLTITGNVSVERYIAGGSSKRGYRLLTSPVNNGNGVFSINFLKNSAYVTGTTKASGGFDVSPNANNPSIYFFRENTAISNTTFSSGNYRGVNNINNAPSYSFDNESGTFTLPVGNGFLFFFRGDRSVADIATETVASYVPTGTTFTATGTLNTGNITVKNWYDQTKSLLYSTTSNNGVKSVSGYNLVANPYASTINMEKFNRQSNQASSSIYGNGFPNQSGTTLTSPLKIWVYNPTSKQYSTYEQKTSINSVADTTTGANPGISSDGYASNLIASGQAFFIRATAAGQTLTFRESAKTNSQPSSAITQAILSAPDRPVLASTSKFAAFAAMPTEQIAATAANTLSSGGESLLRFKLIKDSINTDAIVIGLRTNISPVYNENKDAEDLGGNGAQVSLSAMSSDSVKATIYRSPYPHKVQQVIPLYADATTSGAYQLNLSDVSNLPALYEVWLKDSFTKDSVDIKASKLYNFNIDKGNAASFGKNRFSLVLRQNPALGLRLIDFTATKVATGAQTNWQVQNEANYTLFTVQRSTDNGKTWDNISVFKSTGLGTYSYTDLNPANGLNKYRLQLTDVNNEISLSKELPLMYANTNNNLSNNQVLVYPNPATEVINLSIKQTKASSNYNIRITNSSGILLKNVNITQLYWQNNVSNLIPGTYMIQVIDNKTKSLFGIAKFVKL